MQIEILMPALSPTMTEGNLTKWLVKEGDEIKAGDVLAEIETDKATMEVEAVDEGIIKKLLLPENSQSITVNSPIAILTNEINKNKENKENKENLNKIENQDTKKSVIINDENKRAQICNSSVVINKKYLWNKVVKDSFEFIISNIKP